MQSGHKVVALQGGAAENSRRGQIAPGPAGHRDFIAPNS